jgi:hypothetical protein
MTASADQVRTTRETPGFVYFVRAGRVNTVKIGWAKADVDKRIAELQCGCPHQLHLIGYLPGSLADEYEWHARFHGCRKRGEWFALSGDLRAAINETALLPGAVFYSRLSLLTRNARP